MKNIFKHFIALALILGMWSCENEENFLLLEPQAADFSIITPDSGSLILMNEATPDNTALTLTWEAVDYGTPTIVSYTVQFAEGNTEFAAPINIATLTTTHTAMSVSELNAKAFELGLLPDVDGNIDIRIMSTVGTSGSEPKYSTPITIVVRPYNSVFPKVDLYLVGPGTVAGWDVNKGNMPIYRDTKDNTKQYYTGYFGAEGFKLIEQLGFWAPMYGTNGDLVQYRATEGDADPGLFPIAAAGYYAFTINLKDLTYTLAPYTGPMTVYPVISLTGSVLTGDDAGWSIDVPLVQSTYDSHIWKVRQTLKEGKMKFRANNSWDVSWGDDGADIYTTAGTYDIWFNDLDGRSMLIPVL